MSGNDPFARRLSERFASPPAGEAREGCPDADTIWRAARGEMPWAETERLLTHAAACAACATAWRMARSLSEGEPAAARRRASPPWLRYAASVALVAVLAGLAWKIGMRRTPEAGYRATAPAAIHALVADGSTLPRSHFVLRWTPGPPGTRYAVEVSDERLAAIVAQSGLTDASFQVAQERLSPLADGAQVLWLVKATLPDGERVTSGTFMVRVGTP